jgi:hypothetical protein
MPPMPTNTNTNSSSMPTIGSNSLIRFHLSSGHH